ncbi:hypothetical protein Kpol_1018p83 [Vanderwaltozyma polyspora DSM 70294]|uniref:Uncharacterized protein n=1 Tax=Vanderwaltozyma polyspora (strain ATCC 22028 / DSM 70294 / BCRC 21397 / CBS 2163 / NBRC 10782 / NRRL Y-8283 / UCD 57-17) TaxID=436907 RepID=A7TDT0_VANPO|nr:uncharacterized protein Kpol_1018p83 [Vanderwaltozyma polyspora DSM 70294]EDO19550.1 hypothetical protein Kpol_1018p83 [Vanderwaltozyma polyspora DSM 70294]
MSCLESVGREVELSVGKLWKFQTAKLFNVLPPDLVTGSNKDHSEERCLLFQGMVMIQEYLEHDNQMAISRYQIIFNWNDVTSFCKTDLIDGFEKLNDIVTKGHRYMHIKVTSCNLKVLLELRFQNRDQERGFNDTLFRIQEEYEIMDEIPW